MKNECEFFTHQSLFPKPNKVSCIHESAEKLPHLSFLFLPCTMAIKRRSLLNTASSRICETCLGRLACPPQGANHNGQARLPYHRHLLLDENGVTTTHTNILNCHNGELRWAPYNNSKEAVSRGAGVEIRGSGVVRGEKVQWSSLAGTCAESSYCYCCDTAC